MDITFDDLVARYVAIWNDTNPTSRRRAIDAIFATDARYVDPLVDIRGREAIDAMIGAVQSQFPGFVLRLAGPVDGHHDQARFTWELGPAVGEAPVAGFDVAVVEEGTRLTEVRGFLDRVPAA